MEEVLGTTFSIVNRIGTLDNDGNSKQGVLDLASFVIQGYIPEPTLNPTRPPTFAPSEPLEWNAAIVRYPPGIMTGNSQSLTSVYGSGSYVASASSVLSGSGRDAYRAFDTYDNTDWHSVCNYNVGTGVYASTVSTTYTSKAGGSTSMLGEYIQLQLPVMIKVTQMSLTPSNIALPDYYRNNMPREFVLLGSNTGSSWKEVMAYGLGSNYYTSEDVRMFGVTTNDYFRYYRLVVKRVGTVDSGSNQQGCVVIGEFGIFGSVPTPTMNPTAMPSITAVPSMEPTSAAPSMLPSSASPTEPALVHPAIWGYPPGGMTSNVMSITSAYGSGVYEATGSSEANGNMAYEAFDNDATTYWQSDSTYNANSGQYTGSNTVMVDDGNTVVARSGESIGLKVPVPIQLMWIEITPRQGSSMYYAQNMPTEFWILGSTDNQNWKQLKYVAYGDIVYVDDSTVEVDVGAQAGFYSYFQILVNQVGNDNTNQNGGQDSLMFGEVNFVGHMPVPTANPTTQPSAAPTEPAALSHPATWLYPPRAMSSNVMGMTSIYGSGTYSVEASSESNGNMAYMAFDQDTLSSWQGVATTMRQQASM